MLEPDEIGDLKWRDNIISVLHGGAEPLKLKKLRKQVLLSLQLDDADKAARKRFKAAVQALEEANEVTLSEEGIVALTTKGKKRKSIEKKEKKKKRKLDHEQAVSAEDEVETKKVSDEHDGKTAESDVADPSSATSQNASSKPCKGNPQGVTRLFVGNLPFAVDQASLTSFLPKTVTHIKWITDKETGKFYGSAFIEMDTTASAAAAVALAGSQFMGRPVKVNFAPARPGDKWPPEKAVVSGGSTGQAGGSGVKAMGEKPENCVKLFIGNLSYEIDDEGITKFFASVDAEVKAVRWLHHKESGDFNGWYVLCVFGLALS